MSSLKFAYVNNQLASSLVSLSVIRLLFDLLLDAFPGGAVLQRKLRHDPAELVRSRFGYPMLRNSQPLQELSIPGKQNEKFQLSIITELNRYLPIKNPPVHYTEDDDPFGTIRQEIDQLLLQMRCRIVFADQL